MGHLTTPVKLVGNKNLDLLKGYPKKKKYALNRFPSHGGFPIGKIKNHLKQTQENTTKYCIFGASVKLPPTEVRSGLGPTDPISNGTSCRAVCTETDKPWQKQGDDVDLGVSLW